MRTGKKTHMREKCKAGRDGFESSLCSENRFSEKYVHLEIVSGRDHATTTITMAAGKGGPKRGSPAMRDDYTHAHKIKLREK